MYKLAHFITPTQQLCKEEALYFRPKGSAWYSYRNRKFFLQKGASISFDTYFNALSIGKWIDYTNVESFYLCLKAKGKLFCTIVQIDEDQKRHTLALEEISGDGKEIEISIMPAAESGIVYAHFKALGDVEILQACWGTKTPPVHSVKLGISITTFNRQEAVKASSARILEFLHHTDIDAHLVVVDNGQNLQLDPDEKLTLIPNENLGGSGGFARGLYHLQEERSDFTHALFMDDDASCETESIYRAYKLLSYAKKKNLAIAGAMLFGHLPYIQWENGANFNQRCRPLKSFYNLKTIKKIVKNENGKSFDYGGWWFFAFPIKNAEYPYPFFVRGDDVNYGLQDHYIQMTMNGIGTWGDDFFDKESPLTQYLDTRSHLLHHLQVGKLDQSLFTFYKVFWRFIIRYGFMLKYASVEAQVMALEDVMKGPEFFAENIDMKEVFKKIAPLSAQEKPKPLDLSTCEGFDRSLHFHYPMLMKTVKALTLNGHLIPNVFMNDKGIVLEKSEHRIGAFFRRKTVCLYNKKSKEGFLLHHDKKRFFKLLGRASLLSLRLIKEHKMLKKRYQEAYPYLTSKEYWESKFFPQKSETQ